MSENNLTEGFCVKQYKTPVKRFCQTLDLRNDPKLISTYKHLHSQEGIWKEILEGIKSVGILEMEIYLLGTRLFMIVETPLDFQWSEAMQRLGKLPRQAEWEELTAQYQMADPKAGSAEKWKLMERVFHLYE